jgi:hypothetical protein
MEIHPEDSSGGVTTQGTQSLPSKTTTEVTSNVLVKDNHTIVIGGLFREASTTNRGQYPILGNLPLAGPLFRQQRDTTIRQEVIILITPHIIKDDDAYSRVSEDERAEMEKLRVGVRKGMQPWGRERMAEVSYEWASNEMNKPNPDRCKALWYLDCALNLKPTYLEAIDLKERISGKTVTENDNSIIRRLVMNQVMADKANGLLPEKVPAVVPITPSSRPTSALPTSPATQPVVAALDSTPASTPTIKPALVEAIAPTTAPASQPVADAQEQSEDESASPAIETADGGAASPESVKQSDGASASKDGQTQVTDVDSEEK